MFCELFFAIAFFEFFRRWVRKFLLHRDRTIQSIYEGKNVWITGASSGIGEAFVKQFLKAGASVILSSRREDKLMQVMESVQHIAGDNQRIVIAPLDITSETSVNEAYDKIISEVGQVDVLVNNAGIAFFGKIAETHPSATKKLMDVNYHGSVLMTLTVVKDMMERHSGTIMFVNSMRSKCHLPYTGPYGCTKHALKDYAMTLRSELADSGVGIINIYPGYVNTSIQSTRLGPDGNPVDFKEPAFTNAMSAESFAEKVFEELRLGEEEITICTPMAHFALFLSWWSRPIAAMMERKYGVKRYNLYLQNRQKKKDESTGSEEECAPTKSDELKKDE